MILLILLLLAMIVAATVVVLLHRRRGEGRRRPTASTPRRAERRRLVRAGRRWPPSFVPPGEGRVERIKVGRRTRSYLSYRPGGIGIGTSPPLVIAFHGGFGNPLQFARLTGLNETADRHGFALAYPAALGHWVDGRETTGFDSADIEFVIALHAHLCRNACIDPERVYALGASNGGMFVFRLILEVPQLFAAFSANLAALPVGLADRAKPGPPMPLIIVSAVHDARIPWRGGRAGGQGGLGGTILGAEETVAFWQQRNRCGQPQVVPFWRTPMGTDVVAERYDYAAAADGADLCFLKLLEGGHDWPRETLHRPGSPADGTVTAITVSDMIWEFLSRQVRSETAGRAREPACEPGRIHRQ